MTETEQPAATGSITIVGLGPAGGDLLTRQAWAALTAAEAAGHVLYLRTARHPAVADLPPGLRHESFDDVYESADDFGEVYRQIAAEIVRLGSGPAGVLYAVPGHPHVGEATVAAIEEGAAAAGIPVTIVPGLSFVETALSALGRDAFDGLQVFDAIAVAGHSHPVLIPDVPLLLGQVYNRLLAGELKLALMAHYPDEHGVTLVHAAGSAEARLEQTPLYAVDRSEAIGHLTCLYVPPLPAPGSVAALAEMAAVLRGPGGCPWDQEQTPSSLRAGFLEEMAEVLHALDEGDEAALQEELGDLLFHVVMQVQMAREAEGFRLSDVAGGIYAKIRRRHPHVWGEWEADDAGQVVANWEAIKAEEKARARAGREAGDEEEPPSLLDNVPRPLPALARSRKIQERVRRVGFDWPALEGVVDKVREEIEELACAGTAAERAAEMGDLLFAVVNWARWLELDAEVALREANLRFERRFRQLERLASRRGVDLETADLDTMEALWQEAKGLLADSREGER